MTLVRTLACLPHQQCKYWRIHYNVTADDPRFVWRVFLQKQQQKASSNSYIKWNNKAVPTLIGRTTNSNWGLTIMNLSRCKRDDVSLLFLQHQPQQLVLSAQWRCCGCTRCHTHFLMTAVHVVPSARMMTLDRRQHCYVNNIVQHSTVASFTHWQQPAISCQMYLLTAGADQSKVGKKCSL